LLFFEYFLLFIYHAALLVVGLREQFIGGLSPLKKFAVGELFVDFSAMHDERRAI